MHETTAGHRSLSGTISCVTNRIRFLPVTMTGRFSNFNRISYKEDRHEFRVTGTKCRLPDTMSGTGQIFISGAVHTHKHVDHSDKLNDVIAMGRIIFDISDRYFKLCLFSLTILFTERIYIVLVV